MAVNEGRRRIVGGVDTHMIFTSQRSWMSKIGLSKRDPSPPPVRAIARCSPGCASGDLQRMGVESTGSYGAGLLRFMQQAGIAVLEVTTPTSRIAAGRGKNDDLDALRTRPMPPLQASGP